MILQAFVLPQGEKGVFVRYRLRLFERGYHDFTRTVAPSLIFRAAATSGVM